VVIQGYGVSRVLIGCGVVVCGGDLLVWLMTAVVVIFLKFFASILTI
jgi:hypothetical protein